ncbi:MaoC/PaaZ C-terminal domain-containing protein [Puerhibacterium puerhi]|uniref:MaoC/PaaZ C-terminal domain-containing protein n=1 Tax=Puerhibacterium puerhi TaxID=2692623 RepID=UPI001358E324|nr:MaoC/PaaZ C-terminal domain-containing protein [Puerhibacterium puerhi]
MTAGPLSVTTAGGGVLAVETLPSVPRLTGLYARGAASSGRIAAGRALPSLPVIGGGEDSLTLPPVAYRVAEVDTADMASHLRDYQRLLHEPVSDHLPSGYLHVLAFPLATAVMVRADFPLPLLGMVHLANDAALARPVRLGDRLEVRAWAEDLRAHRRGVQVDLVAEVRVQGDDDAVPAWRGVSTYLARGFDPSEVEGADGADGGDGQAPGDVPGDAGGDGTAPSDAWAPPLPTGRWVLPAGTGRAYGALSGDRNPIHMSALSAKAFGFPRAIAHGMYTAARALADVGMARGDAYRWTVRFAKPVLLPGTVDVAVTPAEDAPGGFTYVGWNALRRQKHFEGTVTPL